MHTAAKTKRKMHQPDQPPLHVPVLAEAVLQYLDPKGGDRYLDLTAGYGGHATLVLERTDALKQAVFVDRDQHAIDELTKLFGSKADIRHMDFLQASQQLAAAGQQFDCILADLGVSSPHLTDAERGFAITAEGPLDMRMDQTQALTAGMIVNRYTEAELAEILTRYGEEPKARRIAQLIVRHRPIDTTTELAHVVARAWGGARSKVHPATRTFQALRIAVNDELTLIARSLPIWIDLLAPGGRLAVISFHSLEDRLVKQAFAEAGNGYDARIRILTKHPVTASDTEVVFNPRARSAKLRAAAKINT
ncbi:MAG TPA: 16S rRNA (cytosine(1402)-N(4))-methyltransferase RsmH [Candidatus Saccharimonadales bacterium]|nr:16S rRNA (cytosine(1402)-N(4))-methyltransferase RsmH [Candidatus Saccharimonadales bacterium]